MKSVLVIAGLILGGAAANAGTYQQDEGFYQQDEGIYQQDEGFYQQDHTRYTKPYRAKRSGRLSTLNLSCSDARAIVRQHGAIVLSTGRHTFDRFVSHQGHCMHGEVIEPAWVPTYDSYQCFIGYTCTNTFGD
jgi:hypothetical protein